MRISDWSSDVCSSDLSQTCRHVATLTAAPHGISRRAMRQSARSRSLCLECKAVGWMRARLCCGRVDPRGLEVRNERSGSGDVCHWRQPDVLVSLAYCAIANVACRDLATLSGPCVAEFNVCFGNCSISHC